VHHGRLAAKGNGERLAVDARFELAVDGVDEVVAVELRVKPQDAAAEQPVEQLDAPGQIANASGWARGCART
jgi:hypothetical protein